MAIWDAIKKVGGFFKDAYGTQFPALIKNAYGTQLPALYKMAHTDYSPPAVTTPEQRAAMKSKQTTSNYPTNNYAGGGSSYISNYGGMPNYTDARSLAKREVASSYDPLRKLLEQEISKNIPNRYADEIRTQKEMLPLNQRKYENLLALLEQSAETSRADIRGQEASALGAAQARAATSGLFNSSVLSGGEQRISKQAMDALTDVEKNRQLRAEGYNTDYRQADQAVYDALANLYNRRDADIENARTRLLSIPADSLGAVENLLGGISSYGNTRANVWNTYNSGSSGKGTFQEYFDPNIGENKVGYFVNGKLVGTPQQAVGGTAGERTQAALYSLLQRYLDDQTVSREELTNLHQRFPGEIETIDSLVAPYLKKQPNFFQRLFGLR